MRIAGVFAAIALLLAAQSPAQARVHSLTGNARFQVGNGIPFPIAFTPVPDGKVAAGSLATIRQHGAHAPGSPARIVLDPGQLTHPGTPLNLPVFGPGPPFQLYTAIQVAFPASQVSFAAGGRSGPPTVTFCAKPGSATAIRAGGNPACAGGSAGTGLLRYTKTSNQFGGPAQAAFGGSANVARPAGSAPPCAGPPACLVVFNRATPASPGALGARFGFVNATSPGPGVPTPGVFFATLGPAATVLGLTTPGLGPGLANPLTSWGGPWTTGRVTASQPSAIPAEKFTLTGSDARAAGLGSGSISLVSGGISQRTLSGANANRGWLNLSVGPVISKTPALPALALGAMAGLLLLVGAVALRGRRGRTGD